MKKIFLSLITCVILISSLYIVTGSQIQNAVQSVVPKSEAAERVFGDNQYQYIRLKLTNGTLTTTSPGITNFQLGYYAAAGNATTGVPNSRLNWAPLYSYYSGNWGSYGFPTSVSVTNSGSTSSLYLTFYTYSYDASGYNNATYRSPIYLRITNSILSNYSSSRIRIL